MKVLLALCLVVAGAVAVPRQPYYHNYHISERDNSNVHTNSIDYEDAASYDIVNSEKKVPQVQHPGLSLPLYVYKQIMTSSFGNSKNMVNIIRSLVKPILTSVEFQVLVDFVDESLKLFKEDPQIKAMVRNGVDSIQEMYQTADSKLAKNLLTWMVSQYSDEETARSFSSLMSDISPALESWVLEPMKKYYRSYITPTIGSLSQVMHSFFGSDEMSNEIARSGRWSDLTDLYISRLSDMTTDAKTILFDTAKFLQIQDAPTEKRK